MPIVMGVRLLFDGVVGGSTYACYAGSEPPSQTLSPGPSLGEWLYTPYAYTTKRVSAGEQLRFEVIQWNDLTFIHDPPMNVDDIIIGGGAYFIDLSPGAPGGGYSW